MLSFDASPRGARAGRSRLRRDPPERDGATPPKGGEAKRKNFLHFIFARALFFFIFSIKEMKIFPFCLLLLAQKRAVAYPTLSVRLSRLGDYF